MLFSLTNNIRQCFIFALLSFAFVFMQKASAEEIPSILFNNSQGVVDVHVILPDGGASLLHSIEPGQQKEEKFYMNEVILITPSGSDDVIQQFTHDGTPNKVFLIESNQQVGVTNSSGRGATAVAEPSTPVSQPTEPAAVANNGCPKDKINCNPPTASTPTPAKEDVTISPQFESWLSTDKIDFNPRVENATQYQNGFQDKFRMEDQMRKGYNILKMDPSRLTERGLGGNAPDLLQTLEGTSTDWHLGALKIAIPNDLEVLPEKARTRGQEVTTLMFSSDEERKSTSVNVGLSAGGKGNNTKGPEGSGKVGISREDKKFEAENKTLIRKQIVGEAYWTVYVKEHMRLSKGLTNFLTNENNLRSYPDFKNFFERYGTHWSLATLFGGYIRYDEEIDVKELSESVSKSLSVDVAGSVPVKAVKVGASVGMTQSNVNEMRQKESSGKASFESQGGQPGASFGMWNMATPSVADNYVPLKVELRAIYELIWPELMGISDPAESNRIHQLRAKMAQMLDQYIAQTQGQTDSYDWSPKIYEVTLKKVRVSQDDDEGSNNEPDFYGKLYVGEAGKPIDLPGGVKVFTAIKTETLWNKGSSKAVTKGKGSTFKLENKSLFISIPPKPVIAKQVNGKPIYKPSFDVRDKYAVFGSTLTDHDNTGKQEYAGGQFGISLASVDKSGNKVITETKEFSDEGVGVKLTGEVRLRDYRFVNDKFELLDLPRMDRLGQGDVIATNGVLKAVSRPTPEEGNTSLSVPAAIPQTKTSDTYQLVRNAAISGHNQLNLKFVSVQNCKDACSNRGWCKSFDYYKKENKCDLSKASASVVGLKTNYPGNPYDHYSRTPLSGNKATSQPQSNVSAGGVSATAGTNFEQVCYNEVQGKVAWSTNGDKTWNSTNVKKLCRGINSMPIVQGRIGCFKTQMPIVGWEMAIKQCGGNF